MSYNWRGKTYDPGLLMKKGRGKEMALKREEFPGKHLDALGEKEIVLQESWPVRVTRPVQRWVGGERGLGGERARKRPLPTKTLEDKQQEAGPKFQGKNSRDSVKKMTGGVR